MDPLTLTSISSLVAYFGPKFVDKSFETATAEFTKGAIKWLKSIFFIDDRPNQVLEDLKEDPHDKLNISAAEIAVQKKLQKNPDEIIWLQEIYQLLKDKAEQGDKNVISILNSKNVLTANKINTGGGDINIGDKNN